MKHNCYLVWDYDNVYWTTETHLWDQHTLQRGLRMRRPAYQSFRDPESTHWSAATPVIRNKSAGFRIYQIMWGSWLNNPQMIIFDLNKHYLLLKASLTDKNPTRPPNKWKGSICFNNLVWPRGMFSTLALLLVFHRPIIQISFPMQKKEEKKCSC